MSFSTFPWRPLFATLPRPNPFILHLTVVSESGGPRNLRTCGADRDRHYQVKKKRRPIQQNMQLFVFKQFMQPLFPSVAGGGLGRWITPRQAVFPDFSFGDMGPLGAALVAAGMPLVDVSPEVCVKFQQSCPSLRYLTPQLLRRQLAIAGGRKPKLTDRATVVLALK